MKKYKKVPSNLKVEIFQAMSKISDDDVYVAVSPEQRRIIIDQIKEGTHPGSGRARGTEKDYFHWRGKHAPENEIPTAIYLCGNGTFVEHHARYNQISHRDLSNYRRELVYQGILIKQ